jgi:hypothetical protein
MKLRETRNKVIFFVVQQFLFHEISGYHGGEYKDDSFF